MRRKDRLLIRADELATRAVYDAGVAAGKRRAHDDSNEAVDAAAAVHGDRAESYCDGYWLGLKLAPPLTMIGLG